MADRTTVQEVAIDEDLVSVTVVYDGTNFIGLYGIPPARGGRYYYAVNGDNGYADTDEDAVREIVEARERSIT